MIPNKRRVLESSSNAGWLEEHNRRIDDAARGKQNAMCRVETLAAELRSLNRERTSWLLNVTVCGLNGWK